MKKFLSTLLTFFILQVQALAVIIPEGTVLSVKPTKTIHADDVKEGSQVYFETVYPIKIDGNIVIKAGTKVQAKVLKKKNNFILGIPGELLIGNFELHTPNNNIIPLQGTIEDKGEGRYWAHVGWFFLFPLLFIKGNDGQIPISYTVTLYTIEQTDY